MKKTKVNYNNEKVNNTSVKATIPVGASIARQQKQNLREAGITLVALVVTIIVLLILARY